MATLPFIPYIQGYIFRVHKTAYPHFEIAFGKKISSEL